MNIINLNIDKQLTTMKAGGGSPNLEIPETLNGLLKIRSELSEFNKTHSPTDNYIVVLFHKTNGVPAISNRFCKCLSVIFGDNRFTYDKNKMLDKGLGFHYTVNYQRVDHAISRLDVIIEFMHNELGNRALNDWYSCLSKKMRDYIIIENRITRFLKNQIGNISKTSLLELLSRSESSYSSLVLAKDEWEIPTEQNVLCSFVNKKYADEAKNILKNEGINVTYNGEELLEIEVPKNKKIILSGLMRQPSNSLSMSFDPNEKMNISEEECLFPFLDKNNETNNIAVGVIDGGISENSIVRKKINYKNLIDLGLSEKHYYKYNIDNHAERVVSMLLWANELSDRTKDNCKQPKVTLFDVVRDKMSTGDFLQTVTTIVEKYYKEIRIWNISVNISHWRNGNSWKNGITEFAVEFDKLQKKYNVLFILATGNENPKDDNKFISTPADAVRGISVACCLQNGQKTEYSLNGQCTENLYYVSKPDLATTGCDAEGYFRVISDSFFTTSQGVSFAVPLITRKVAELYAQKIDLNMIPAILDCMACHHAKKLDDYLGYGILPMDINEILEMKKNNALVLFSVNPIDYSQGFFRLKLPKDASGNYPLSFTFGVNVEANTADNSCFEYVEDTARIQIGAVDPNKNTSSILQHTKIQIFNGDDDEAYTIDDKLRKLFGKYKNRYCCKRVSQRAIQGNNSGSIIEYFGITITRNDIRSKRNGNLKTHVCLLINSINDMHIFDEILTMNRNLINVENQVNDYDDIGFE